jgi:hypothetical protein
MKLDYHLAGIRIEAATRSMAIATGYTFAQNGDHAIPVHWHENAIEQLAQGLLLMGYQMVKIEGEASTEAAPEVEPPPLATESEVQL